MKNARLRVLVGLEVRLYAVGPTEPAPKFIGTPSLMPFSSNMPSRLGSGKFDSGPAMPCRMS